jgi:hypothetical protein
MPPNPRRQSPKKQNDHLRSASSRVSHATSFAAISSTARGPISNERSGFVIASHLFGLGMWMYGFLVTYDLWGGTGIFVGLLLGGIGGVPLAIIAAALKQMWTVVGELV